jgi:hypothetical protein
MATTLLESAYLDVTVSGSSPSDVGVLAHALIAAHAHLAHRVNPQLLATTLAEAARPAVTTRNANERAVTVAVAVGYARRYLQSLAPAGSWVLLGTEFPLGQGNHRADVVWRHAQYGWILVDEVKTTQLVRRRVGQPWLDQVNLYAQFAADLWGALTVGVRLLPIATPNLSLIVRPGCRPLGISPTPESPYAPAMPVGLS